MAENNRIVNMIPTGKYTTYYDKEKTKIRVISNYNSNGNLHGSYIEYYENGNKMLEENFIDGKRHGSSSFYLEDGTKVTESKWENGIIVKYRTANPKIRTVWDEFSLNGYEFNGPFKTYTINANPSRFGSYLEDRYTGTLDMWYYDLTYKILQNVYHDGMKVMKTNNYWDKEGNPTVEVTYKSNGYKLTAKRWFYGLYANGDTIDFTFDPDSLSIEVVKLR